MAGVVEREVFKVVFSVHAGVKDDLSREVLTSLDLKLVVVALAKARSQVILVKECLAISKL